MIRVYVVVEGYTEEVFVERVLAPALRSCNVHLIPTIVGRPGHKGGRTEYQRVKGDVLKLLKQEQNTYCTTMLDFSGLGRGFPGMPLPPGLSNLQKVVRIEHYFKKDIENEIPNLRPNVRFLPYLQLHEFEALLFSDPHEFARSIGQPHLANCFQQIRNQFNTPEDINDGVGTTPSKRISSMFPEYQKPLNGPQAAEKITLPRMRQECHHFDEWVRQLEKLVPL